MAQGSSSSGIGFFGLLAIVFITLKLIGIQPVTSWSWWWVLSPIWVALAIFLVALIIISVVYYFVKH